MLDEPAAAALLPRQIAQVAGHDGEAMALRHQPPRKLIMTRAARLFRADERRMDQHDANVPALCFRRHWLGLLHRR